MYGKQCRWKYKQLRLREMTIKLKLKQKISLKTCCVCFCRIKLSLSHTHTHTHTQQMVSVDRLHCTFYNKTMIAIIPLTQTHKVFRKLIFSKFPNELCQKASDTVYFKQECANIHFSQNCATNYFRWEFKVMWLPSEPQGTQHM
jgi:hypothetical protein